MFLSRCLPEVEAGYVTSKYIEIDSYIMIREAKGDRLEISSLLESVKGPGSQWF